MIKPLCTIVGMGKGVSYSIAKRFAKEGFRIAMIARRASSLEKLQADLEKDGITAHSYLADAGDFAQLKKAFGQIEKELGHTEVLVYNVSVYREALPTNLDAETSIKDFRSNVAGALVAAQQVVPHMKKKKKGSILITGGGTALEAPAILSSLAIGKSGIRSLALTLHKELKPLGIHAATITIHGMIDPKTKFSPDLIAEEFWKLHQQPEGKFDSEVIYE